MPTVVFVDDSPEMLSFYRELAEDCDFEAIFIESYHDFVMIDFASIKMVVTDYHLGNGYNGDDIISWVRDNNPSIYCILCSGSFEDNKLADVFFQKPPDILELISVLENCSRD